MCATILSTLSLLPLQPRLAIRIHSNSQSYMRVPDLDSGTDDRYSPVMMTRTRFCL